ncbi:MAG: phosphotransferase [Betaproteobacteria bacterium]|nr:phosphotransferase [Betaproteobacteria bacterium]
MERTERLRQWVESALPAPLLALEVASADASFRRYFRARTAAGSYIVMDAPPSHEDCRPYIHIARLFRAAGANTPEILAENPAEGFLLLSDFGDTTYLAALTRQSAGAPAGSLAPTLSQGEREQSLGQNRIDDDTADGLYRDANAALIQIQLASRPGELPDYDEALLTRELRLFPEWYLAKHLKFELSAEQSALLDTTFRAILDNNLAQAKVYVHRDWHSRNLMVTEPNPGVLDFQDAVYGPITYDLVSIYKDAYIKWDEARVLDWTIRYWEAARRAGLPVPADFADFYRDFEWMGVQRHIKVLGIFARLYHRDGKAGYLKDMPLVMHYLRRACERYNALAPFLRFLDALEGRQAEVGYTF